MRRMILGALAALPLSAGAVSITSSFTGNWFDPNFFGQGLQMQVVGSSTRPELLLTWYTYDATGKPLWLIGQTPITGDRLSFPISEVSGPKFAQPSSSASLVSFGQVELEFSDCNHGILRFDTRLGAGTRQIQRNTNTVGANCTGGLIDSTPAVTTSESFLPISSVAGNANARFRTEPGRLSFRVQLENAPAGNYPLIVAGQLRGSISVNANNVSTEIEFKSPRDNNSLLLDFDPRGQTLALVTANQGGSTSAPVQIPPFGNSERIVPLQVGGLGSGELKLKQKPSSVDFSVELEDVPVGNYSIKVGDTVRGLLQVSNQGGRNKGETEYSYPRDVGKLLLDFDPRGQRVEISQAGVVIASGVF